MNSNFKKIDSVIGLFGAALIGGAAGYLGGGLLGYEIENSNCNDNYEDSFCGIAEFLILLARINNLVMIKWW